MRDDMLARPGHRHWDPTLYLKYADLRMRPALELLQRIPLAAPDSAHDLGCGPGDTTLALRERWPGVRLCGVDSSRDMLDTARARAPELDWQQADIAQWTPAHPTDLIFASAVLHFLGDHDTLLPRLLHHVRPGGCLALHMPDWWSTPWYRLMHEVLATGGSAGQALGTPALRMALARNPVESASFYYTLLAPHARCIDIWETDYLQVVDGDDPVFEWIRASGLRTVTDHLEHAERARFVAQYLPRLRGLYPRRADGQTLFPFKRLFIVAQRQG
jgi:trans-aconitate 2-methyltransferase